MHDGEVAVALTSASSDEAAAIGNEREAELVEIARVTAKGSPRLAGEDPEHVRALAGTEEPLPPILVHRPTMRVIDGVHRLRAAVMRGEDRIPAYFFEGDADAAFVLAVEANIRHGLPLTLPDREAAAARIVASYPHWSDRAIAARTGLTAKTVAAIRNRSAPGQPPATARIGLDGRARPLDATEGRLRAAKLIGDHPEMSLRQVARLAGLSLGTARDVKERMRKGLAPVPVRARGRRPRSAAAVPLRLANRPAPQSQRDRLYGLKQDPSLHSDSGRKVLRWLNARVIGTDDWSDLVEVLPAHCAYIVADIALNCAAAWRELAGELERRVQATESA
ncbi:ParB N-terminal domain-containing protein [Nonomuraea sp. H19]|uniref:ParB/RepB/Spo0J family partition protein n=1 Tax=Nonomuraea sp. H19 TaxID=3452206 RepID=UPI003F88866B